MRFSDSDFRKLISNFNRINILVIGDIMLDKYIQGSVSRISPEAPVPVVKVEKTEYRIGGAGNVAANLTSLGCNVTLASFCGNDKNGRQIEELLIDKDITPRLLFSDSRPTTVKTRIMAKHQQIVRVDKEETSPVKQKIQTDLLNQVNKTQYDGIILSDYKKGLITGDYILKIEEAFPNIPIIVDPKGHDYSKYRSATVIKPNWNEFKTAINKPDLELDNIDKHAMQMIKNFHLEGLIITLGENGVYVLEKSGKSNIFPTLARDVFDVSGAGDTFIAAFSAAFLSSKNWQMASYLANITSGIVVGKLGTAVVTSQEILDNLHLYI